MTLVIPAHQVLYLTPAYLRRKQIVMKTASLLESNIYKTDKPSISLLLETDNTKEIKILFRKGQVMKKHHAPFPIVVEVFEGSIDFGVDNVIKKLKKGDLISLESSAPHDLLATSDAIVRLSLSKEDNAERVQKVTE